MKATVDKLDGLSRKLNVEVPTEKVKKAFEKVYRALQKNATIKGFRKGKAPLDTVRSVYGDKVRSDVAQELIQENYEAALNEHSLSPIGFPQISFEALKEDAPFAFTAEFEIRPEVKVAQYEGLKIEKERLEIPAEKIQSVLENIRQNQAETVPVFEDRPLQEGDIADLNFKGMMNGADLPNGSAEGHQLEIGSGQFIPGFEEAMTGMKAGTSKTISLKFPDEYHEKSIAGQPVQFEVKLNSIKKKSLPELNDEMAKKVGKFETLNDLKKAIEDDIKNTEERRIKEEVRNNILKALADANPVETPQSLVQEQKQALIEDFKKRLSQQGFGDKEFDDYKSKWDQDFESTATFMVQSTFLLDKLAEDLKLRATQEDFENKIKEFSEQSGMEVDKVKQFYQDGDRRGKMLFQITEEKVIDFLISKASIKEVDPKPQEATS